MALTTQQKITGLGLGLVIVLAGYFGFRQGSTRGNLVDYQVGQASLKIEIRDTDEGRELGLSNLKSLGKNEGMLFVFPEAAVYSFWMKEMLFPLDMIWIKSGQVVHVTQNIPAPQKGEQPVTITPESPIDAVLEVNAGWAEKNGIKVGDLISN